MASLSDALVRQLLDGRYIALFATTTRMVRSTLLRCGSGSTGPTFMSLRLRGLERPEISKEVLRFLKTLRWCSLTSALLRLSFLLCSVEIGDLKEKSPLTQGGTNTLAQFVL